MYTAILIPTDVFVLQCQNNVITSNGRELTNVSRNVAIIVKKQKQNKTLLPQTGQLSGNTNIVDY